VQLSSLGNTSATVTWDTNIDASSILYYSQTITGGELDDPDTATCPADYSTIHSCSMSGLDVGTTYYYSIKSVKEGDANAYAVHSYDIGGNFHNFTTLTDNTAPIITPDANNPLILTDTQAALSWETDERANSWILYGEASHNSGYTPPATDFDPDDEDHNPYTDYLTNASSNLSHTFVMSLDSLDPNTKYYYRLVSEDTSGNVTVYSEDDFTTLDVLTEHQDLTDPGNPQISQKSDTEAVVYLAAANTDATSRLCYGEEEIDEDDIDAGTGTCTLHADITAATKSHFYHLTGLTADTTYYIRTKITDSETSSITFTSDDDVTFETEVDPEKQHEPISGITDITVPTDFITDTHAIAKFNTDAASVCYAEMTTSAGIYIEGNFTVFYEDGYNNQKYNNSHTINFTDLIFSTPYYFKIKCRDNLFDSGGSLEITSEENTFTTLEEQGSDADLTPPEISNVSTGSITGESVTVSWETDENSSSNVKYGIKSGTYDNEAGNTDVNSNKTNYVKSHEVIINNLIPATKYYFITRSIDASGNIGESDESSFTTKSASNLSSIKFNSVKLGEVNITWKSSAKTTSVVEYGETEIYTESKDSNTQTQDHSLNISGLKSNTEYHFRVSGKDASNNLYSSGDYTFTPKSPPQISNVKIKETKEHEAVLAFATNVATDALITYKNSQDDKEQGSQGNPTLTTTHELTLKNLFAGATYQYVLTVKDIDGNAAVYPETGKAQPVFTTGKDENPPKIDQVRTDSALAQNDKVQTIISWITDEPANTAVIYKEGQSAESREVKVSDNSTTNHIAVVTFFKPGTVYYFKVKSTDASGNASVSSDFALLTPKRKENIIQIIVSNFQDIFSWAKF
jgi:hypothetical protein